MPSRFLPMNGNGMINICNNTIIMKRYLIYLAVAALSLAESCTRDHTVDSVSDSGSRTEVDALFSLRLPANYSSNIASADENLVRNAYILSFRADEGTPDGSEPFDYMSLAYKITDASDTRYKNLVVKLLQKEYPQVFVIITNAKKTVDDLGLAEGSMTKDEVLEALEFSNKEPWHSEMGSNFIPLPMWGETGRETVNTATKTIGTVFLTRMVARLDVVLDAAVDGDKFEITSLHLYNHLTNGRIAPSRASSHWYQTDWRALQPTLPTVDYQKVKGPHAVNTVYAADGTARVPVVYAFESPRPGDGSASDATCLVVGGVVMTVRRRRVSTGWIFRRRTIPAILRDTATFYAITYTG